jgi:hypothetical protein
MLLDHVIKPLPQTCNVTINQHFALIQTIRGLSYEHTGAMASQ